MRETGATLLAPCIGNLHGRYLQQPKLRFDLLRKLDTITRPAGHYLVMHGTDDLLDPIWLEQVACGATKFNINSWARDPTNAFIQKSLAEGKLGMPEIYDEASNIYAGVVERFMKLLGSAGKADQ
jgi:fructose-bisphosphate aldolase, class II